jgi:hypothetical protein
MLKWVATSMQPVYIRTPDRWLPVPWQSWVSSTRILSNLPSELLFQIKLRKTSYLKWSRCLFSFPIISLGSLWSKLFPGFSAFKYFLSGFPLVLWLYLVSGENIFLHFSPPEQWTKEFFFFFVVLVFEFRAFTLSHSTSPTFCDRVFWDRVSWTICPGLVWTVILLISASWVAKITGVGHWHLT